jgi:hypothetical protein
MRLSELFEETMVIRPSDLKKTRRGTQAYQDRPGGVFTKETKKGKKRDDRRKGKKSIQKQLKSVDI